MLLRARHLHSNEGLRPHLVAAALPYVKMLPAVKKKLAEENEKVRRDLEPSLIKDVTSPVDALPARGCSKRELLTLLGQREALDSRHTGAGKITGAMYSDDAAHKEVASAFSSPPYPPPSTLPCSLLSAL